MMTAHPQQGDRLRQMFMDLDSYDTNPTQPGLSITDTPDIMQMFAQRRRGMTPMPNMDMSQQPMSDQMKGPY